MPHIHRIRAHPSETFVLSLGVWASGWVGHRPTGSGPGYAVGGVAWAVLSGGMARLYDRFE